MLIVDGIDSFYQDAHILHGVSLQVPSGAGVAIVGRNGAGKSTILNSVLNSGPTVRGTVSWKGEALGRTPAYVRARKGICLVPEDRRILADMTVLENLKVAYGGIAKDRRRDDPETVLKRFPMLADIGGRKAGVLSGGQQQLLALARAAIARPSLLLLDEPTEGLAPVIVEGLVDEVMAIRRDNACSLLLCEQTIWFAKSCTEYVYVLDTGRVVFGGTWAAFDAAESMLSRHLSV